MSSAKEKSNFEKDLSDTFGEIGAMLISKNKLYGNSALEPKRVFSKADAIEQFNVRIDDKLSRIANSKIDSEDSELDLIGYLILRRMARRMNDNPEYNLKNNY